MNEAVLRKIIREETDNLAKREEIGSIVTNAIEPLLEKIDELGNRLDQSDEIRDRLISQFNEHNENMIIAFGKVNSHFTDVFTRLNKIEEALGKEGIELRRNVR